MVGVFGWFYHIRRSRRLVSLASSSRLKQPPLVRQFSTSEPFAPPPSRPLRRVVVTGIGMVTPLGCGVETTWNHLIEGKSGVRAITLEDLQMSGFDRETQLYTFDQLASKVAACVPSGANKDEFNVDLWLNSKRDFRVNVAFNWTNCPEFYLYLINAEYGVLSDQIS